MIGALLGALLTIAQPTAPAVQSPGATSGADLTVYLMTMGQGDQVWARFGHNAIRIVDASRGTDSVYNWGTFDFDQPNFISRFLTGNTLYWMQGDGIAETLATYRYLNRSIWVQELDLTPAERAAVRDFVNWNAQPANRYYRYDYYLDNCSTRVRDLIDRIVGGQLKAAMGPRLTSTTYRFHTQRALMLDRAVAMGTNIGLGQVSDRPISEWDEAFLPGRLQAHIRGIQIRSADGTTRPLVKAERELFKAQRPDEATAPPNDTLRNLIIGLVIAGLLAITARSARAGRRAGRIGFVTAGTTWAALNGLLGVVLIVGWTATRHVFMARNENLLQFDPLSLALAVMLPLSVTRGRAGKAATLATVIAVISLVGLAVKVLPWFDQVNVAVIALTLPVHLALAWGLRMIAPHAAPDRSALEARAVISKSAA